jgi:hypothetical protein
MDMFRMLQTLEREPQDDFNHIYDASPAPGRVPLVSAVECCVMRSGRLKGLTVCHNSNSDLHCAKPLYDFGTSSIS